MNNDLAPLIELLKERNILDEKIARLIGRPATTGHIGEYIAASIFNIALENSASNKGYDGRFLEGPLAGRTVDIKCYTKHENVLDLPQDAALLPPTLPSYYLVLTGTKSAALSSRNTHRPLVIESIFLFEAIKLIRTLDLRANQLGRKVKFGLSTSIPKQFWDEAKLYPTQRNQTLVLSPEQKRILAVFHET
jgi:hypothetical protein